jgi:acetamidase/formamidase
MNRIAIFIGFAVPFLAQRASLASDEPAPVIATTYYRTFSHAHPVLKRIKPGEVVTTKTVDSAGLDEKDVKRSEPFNPLTGPFFIEGAEPGDAIVVHLQKVRLNRDWGWSAYRLGLFALAPETVEHIYPNDVHPDLVVKGRSTLVPWDIDRKANTVRLRTPKSQVHPLEFPAKPMLGCIGVAPAGDFAPTSGPSGSYGGNLDYNKIGEGSTVYLPVYHPGGMLFVGDGHALQADGEPTGTGIETSMDVAFVVELKKGVKLTGPRVETADAIISIGSQPEFASALDNGLKIATSDMASWLVNDYGMETWAAHLLIGYQGRYDVVTVAGSMALCVPKDRLPKRKGANAAAGSSATDLAPKAVGSIGAKTAKLTKIDGFIPLYYDEPQGKLFMEISRFDDEFLYQVALTSGLGSNAVGLDRGQLGESRVVTFRRAGPKVLLVETNYKYRAVTDRAAERRAVDESFAQSVHWGFKVEAEEPGRVLVDATAFFLRDAHGVAERLKQAKQGAYRLDDSRSALEPGRLKGFPKNTEVEAILTFSTEGETGRLVAQAAAAPGAVTLRQRHSLVELPPLRSGFTPRRPDPRVGIFTVDFYDFATRFSEPVERQYIARHRLVKKDPKAEISEPVAPIVYYVDSAAPEPVRSALVEGASWWARAFEAAGFKNAFKVEVLPDDADAMDLRYNVVQWVHRSTRGWSYGSSVIDPRTGEILKGRVTLDSLRARQDALIGTGLSTGEPRAGACAAGLGPGVDHLAKLDPAGGLEAMVLARIRQLSAHEVGHTLGLAHNFAASACGRASVMDYPAPLVKIRDGKTLDLSDAYASGLGAYDLLAIRYAYAQFPDQASEAKRLDEIVERGADLGLLFLSDADARPAGAAHPLANLWDNGDDPVAELRHELKVRAIGLEQFGLDSLAAGEPLSDLEAKLLPLYLHHRYQLQAAVKTLGGVRYSYAIKDGATVRSSSVAAIEPADRQRAALDAVLETLDPGVLMIPDRLLALIPPQAYNRPDGIAERFAGNAGRVFDPVAAAVTAADLAVSGLLNPERAARLTDFHARDPKAPGFGDVVAALINKTWTSAPADGRAGAVARAVQWLVVTRLIVVASDQAAAPSVRAEAAHALSSLDQRIGRTVRDGGLTSVQDSHAWAVAREIRRFLDRPDPTHQRATPPPSPPGDPIGAGG